MGSANGKAESEEKGQDKGNKAEQQLIKNHIIEREKELNDTIAKIEDNPSLADILQLFDKMKDNPDWDELSDTIMALKDKMKEITDIVFSLQGSIEQERIDTILGIIDTFKRLLVSTNKSVKNVCTQAHIQEKNLRHFMANIDNKEEKEGTEDGFDEKAFAEQLYTLSKWMSVSAIDDTIKQWTVFCQTCRREYLLWEALIAKTKDKAKPNKRRAAFMAAFGGFIGTAGAVVLILTLPISGPILGGCGLGVQIAAAGTALFGAGMLIAGCSVRLDEDSIKKLNAICEKEIKIRGALRTMMYFGRQFEQDAQRMVDIKESNISEYVKQLKDDEIQTKQPILDASKSILEYLYQYQKEGRKITDNVNFSQQVFVDTWANMAMH